MNIEPPKDADGREVSLDTKVLYDRYGNANDVRLFAYFANSDTWRVRFTHSTSSYFAVSDMYLDGPDSWEKLDEDLYAVETFIDSPDCHNPICAYAHNIGKWCADCKLYMGDCTVNMCTDIASRINKLRGDGK